MPTKDYYECSAADLIAQFVGQSAPKTREVMRSALGKVLFVDEAYRLQDGQFGIEAVNEIVDCLTKPDFMGKLVMIIAGYTDDINSLLRVNPGLASRFPEEVFFQSMKPHDCLTLLRRQLEQAGLDVVADFSNNCSPECLQVYAYFRELSEFPSWGNGRDIRTLSKKIAASAFENADADSSSVEVSADDILAVLGSMLAEQSARNRTKRRDTLGAGDELAKPLTQFPDAKPAAPMRIGTATRTKVEDEPKASEGADTLEAQPPATVSRDPNVSDEIWEQLQRDILANLATEECMKDAAEAQERAVQRLREDEDAKRREIGRLEKAMQELRQSRKEADDLKRKLEEERLKALEIKRKKDEEEVRLKKLREEEEARRKKEAQTQKKLRDMGVCPAGFNWIKQPQGYRCGGGSHFVTNSQLGI